jgi:hypothetical protein
MRKLRIFEHISLDGVIEVSGGAGDDDFPHGDWTAPYRMRLIIGHGCTLAECPF